MHSTVIEPIGLISTPFREKFGIPRQPGLARAARGQIHFHPPYDREDYFRGLEGFSHLWLIFLFHQHQQAKLSPTIRPPRLGGNQRIGVFASRSSFRPNHLGQSVVRLEAIHRNGDKVSLEVSGVDLLDQTPIVDIKPYLSYCDALQADNGYLSETVIPQRDVVWNEQARHRLKELSSPQRPMLRALADEVLAQDPRPAYHAGSQPGREYGIRLYDVNIRFCVEQDVVQVIAVSVAPVAKSDN